METDQPKTAVSLIHPSGFMETQWHVETGHYSQDLKADILQLGTGDQKWCPWSWEPLQSGGLLFLESYESQRGRTQNPACPCIRESGYQSLCEKASLFFKRYCLNLKER